MSLFSWFGKKTSPESTPSLSSDLGQVDATLPLHRPLPQVAERSADSNSRKHERLERRELLYAVVRDCMNGAGVLTSSYKFKVLSLDSGGRKYLIMIDLPREQLSDPAQLAEIEGSIARSAKERHEILVTAVYWRVNELVTAGLPTQSVPAPVPPEIEREPEPEAAAAAVPTPPAYAPLQDEEVLAFKRAVAAAASGAAAKRGEVVQSRRRNPQSQPDFSNTEPYEGSSPLGTSQFGGLD
jgi:hypothetical protein